MVCPPLPQNWGCRSRGKSVYRLRPIALARRTAHVDRNPVQPCSRGPFGQGWRQNEPKCPSWHFKKPPSGGRRPPGAPLRSPPGGRPLRTLLNTKNRDRFVWLGLRRIDLGLNLSVLRETPPGGPGEIQAPGRTFPGRTMSEALLLSLAFVLPLSTLLARRRASMFGYVRP